MVTNRFAGSVRVGVISALVVLAMIAAPLLSARTESCTGCGATYGALLGPETGNCIQVSQSGNVITNSGTCLWDINHCSQTPCFFKFTYQLSLVSPCALMCTALSGGGQDCTSTKRITTGPDGTFKECDGVVSTIVVTADNGNTFTITELCALCKIQP